MLNLHQDPNGFTLAFKGRELLKHDVSEPCLEVAAGTGSFQMRHGSFTIRDRLKRRQTLTRFDIDSSQAGRIAITFGEYLRLTCEEAHGRLEIRFTRLASWINRVWLTLQGCADEHIYGCGEQYSRLDLKGSSVPLWVEEQGVGRGKDLVTWLANITGGAGGDWYTTYFPQPTFVSSENYFCHVETSAYAVFDFAAPQTHRLHTWDVPSKIVFDVAESAPAVLTSLSAYMGRQPRMPEWVFDGLWLGVQGGKDAVREKLELAQRAGVLVKAVWVQDWVGRRTTLVGKNLFWDWRANQEFYDRLPEFIQELQGQGVNFLGYINSFLTPEGDLYREAEKKGYLVQTAAGLPYQVKAITFPVGIVDLTNPDARTWLKGVIKDNLLNAGMKGWMADFGEHLPVDAKLHSGENAESFHNKFPVAWAELNREALQEAGMEDDAVFFTRAGYSGVSRSSPLFWAGDQNVNWSLDDGLATVIPAAISLGFSGIGHTHFDLGGYTGIPWLLERGRELLWRWAEVSAFSPVMRSHEGVQPQANCQVFSDPETLAHTARLTRVFVGLKPYLMRAAEQYQQTGLPLVRHPYIHYESDRKLHKHQYQYLLGRDLLIAPVYLPKKDRWSAYLPDDDWCHLWSGQQYTGGWSEVAAPLGQPPVFYRRQSEFVELFAALPKLADGSGQAAQPSGAPLI